MALRMTLSNRLIAQKYRASRGIALTRHDYIRLFGYNNQEITEDPQNPAVKHRGSRRLTAGPLH
jgi:hypothetical protein